MWKVVAMGLAQKVDFTLMRYKVQTASDNGLRYFRLQGGSRKGSVKPNLKERLQRMAGRAHKIAQHGNIRAVGSDAPGIDWQSEALGQVQIDTGIVQLGKTETLRWQNAVQACRVDGPRRPATLPGAPRQLVKLLPIAFVPSRHANS